MDIGVLGTGIVGRTLGTALVKAGHRVKLGSRSVDNGVAAEWAAGAGPAASQGAFADAAAFGEVLFNCTAGAASLEALRRAGEENLQGRIVVDVANPLDFSRGMPPTLTVCNTDSLGEQIQRAFPAARVVKALNTMTCSVMVDPGLVPGDHHVLLCGDDAGAKACVATLLSEAFGWPRARILDLGDITAARGTEMLLPVWIRLWQSLGTNVINFQIAGTPAAARVVPEPLPTP